MAEFATLPKAQLMYIIRLVTNAAVTCCRFKFRIQVAFLAGRHGMQADQGKACHVMLETDALTPTIFIMALFTLLSFLSLVDIILSMATETAQRKLFSVSLSPVTGCATNLLMFSE